MEYFCYGLTIESELTIPELQGFRSDTRNCKQADVSIRIGRLDTSEFEQGQWHNPNLWSGNSKLLIKIPKIADYLICEGKEIIISPHSNADEDNIRLFLLGSAFGALLVQRGFLVLHGNAIQVNNACMVCLGESGAGKSTLAAAFMQRGYSVLSDDVVPVNAKKCAVPGFARIKIWQDTADSLRIDTQKLKRIAPELEKFNYPVPNQFVSTPLPIKWIYILDKHEDSEFVIETVSGMDRFEYLNNNTYRRHYLNGVNLNMSHLEQCGDLASSVHLAKIRRPNSGFFVDQLMDEILDDIRNA